MPSGTILSSEARRPGSSGPWRTTSSPRDCHRAERAHAAVGLELLAVDEDQLAGGLLAAGEQRAEHHGVGAGDQRLGDVAGVLQAAVADDRDAGRPAASGGLVDRGDLRDADAGDDAGGADRAGADADLDAVDAGVDERLRAVAGGDVAADDLHVPGRGSLLSRRTMSSIEAGVAVARCRRRGRRRRRRPACVARSQASPQTPTAAPTSSRPSASLVACGYCSALTKSLTVMRPARRPVVVDERKLLDLVLAQQRRSRPRRRCRPVPVTSGIGVMTSRDDARAPRRDGRSAGRGW